MSHIKLQLIYGSFCKTENMDMKAIYFSSVSENWNDIFLRLLQVNIPLTLKHLLLILLDVTDIVAAHSACPHVTDECKQLILWIKEKQLELFILKDIRSE